jgi:hypothetical protein
MSDYWNYDDDLPSVQLAKCKICNEYSDECMCGEYGE